MNTLTGIIAAAVLLAASFTWGYSSGKTSVKVKDFEAYTTAVNKRDELQTKLNNADVALLEAQQERDALRDKEVVKYVKVYRDRIKDPVVKQCVADSGLLNVYDATVSTPGK